MNQNIARSGPIVAAILGGLLTQGCAAPSKKGMATEVPPSVHALETTRNWPSTPRATVRLMLEKYGKPDQISSRSLAWYYNRPWQATEVFRDPGTRHRLTRNKDYLRQTVSYYVPEDKIADIMRFDPRLRVDTVRAELSARSDSEDMNYLALNLADDIVTEKRSVENARSFYIRTRQLALSGKMSPYLDRLLFTTPVTNNFY